MEKNLSSVIKKNKGIKISRKELMQNSPIPWLVLLGITAIASAFLVWPNASDWMQKRKELKAMSVEIPIFEEEQKEFGNQEIELKEAFDFKASKYLVDAQQRFPETLNTSTVAQIIEIYTILMESHHRANTIEINSLSVGRSQNVDGQNYAETPVNLTVTVDREMLETLISFLKTSQIPTQLRNKILDSQNASLVFLDFNKLPVGRINLLSLNEESRSDRSVSNSKVIYNAQIQVLFYSKPL